MNPKVVNLVRNLIRSGYKNTINAKVRRWSDGSLSIRYYNGTQVMIFSDGIWDVENVHGDGFSSKGKQFITELADLWSRVPDELK